MANPTEEEVIRFFADNPNPTDQSVHNWAESKGWDEHAVEEVVYRIVTKFASFWTKGLANENKLTREKVDQKQLERGIEVEQEHTTSRDVAERIALDHLAEDKAYYTHLDEMEKEHKKEGVDKMVSNGVLQSLVDSAQAVYEKKLASFTTHDLAVDKLANELIDFSVKQSAGVTADYDGLAAAYASLIDVAEDIEKSAKKLTPGSLKGGKSEPSSKEKPGKGGRFKSLVSKLRAKGDVKDPKAVAAAIGRAKFGKKKFQGMAAKGKKSGGEKSASDQSNHDKLRAICRQLLAS